MAWLVAGPRGRLRRSSNPESRTTLAVDVRTRDGVMIVPAGAQISPMLMEKLRNFAQLENLEEPMKVTE